MDTGNYRKRMPHKLAREVELPKLTFQVIRRTIATLMYMEEIPESVRATVNAIHQKLRVEPENLGAN